ncbi:hypothetical protein [Idiomarina abyssalis]|uniref:hypothetical protein n=1 Tax=Idiomarina abyssalis TaxID=86102 RepID=UPI001CD26BFF|nr:hypothetical protein [Idiomarina abyssalis]
MNNTPRNLTQSLEEQGKAQPTGRSWLEGEITADTWQFKEYLEGQYSSRLRLTWQPTFDVSDSVANINWELWKTFAKQFCAEVLDGKQGLIRTSSAKGYVQNIKSVCQFLCFARQCPNVKAVEASDILAYEEHIRERGVSLSHATSLLIAVHSLFKDKKEGMLGLSFDPYPIQRRIKTVAKSISRKDGHTPTLEPEIGLNIIDCALREIKNGQEVVADYEKYLELKAKTKRTLAAKHFRQQFGIKVSELIRKVDILYGAALVVVLSLSAMRKHEASQITYTYAKSLVEGERETLTGRVYKTAGTSVGLETNRGVVPEVIQAIELIIRITEPMRRESDHKLLLLRTLSYNSVSRGQANPALSTTSLYALLDKFTDVYCPADVRLRPHMFRRFFSMMWAWRFETGDLSYLSQLLFHNGYEFTKAYTEDEDVWRFMPEELRNLTYSIFEDALIGKQRLVGNFSKAITKYMRMLQSKVTIVEPKHASRFAELLVERLGYFVVPANDGYCFMSSSRGRRAKCSTNGIGPDYSNRSEHLCAGCPNFGVPSNRERTWEARLRAHEIASKTAYSDDMKSASQKGINTARKILIQFKAQNEN